MDDDSSVLPPHVLVTTYPLGQATPEQYAELCTDLAPAFAAVSGLVAKTWLANTATGRYGAVYTFASKAACDAFVTSELFATLREHAAIGPVEARDFAVDVAASRVTAGVGEAPL